MHTDVTGHILWHLHRQIQLQRIESNLKFTITRYINIYELEQCNRNIIYLLFHAVWVIPVLEIVWGVIVVIPRHSMRYSKSSVDISSSHICDAEAKVRGRER